MMELDNQSWRDEAACRGADPAMFYSEGQSKEARILREKALELCGKCAVKDECLEYSISNKEAFGVWGGVIERQRKRLIKQRRIDAQKAA